MLDEIIGLFNQQLVLYNNIYEVLNEYNSNKGDLDILKYFKELENVDKAMDIIQELSQKLEVLKEAYAAKNCIYDFTGEYIKKVESPDKYNELKFVVDALTGRIAEIKKMQDRIMSSITKEMDFTKKLLIEVNDSKKAVVNYKKLDESSKSEYINVKK